MDLSTTDLRKTWWWSVKRRMSNKTRLIRTYCRSRRVDSISGSISSLHNRYACQSSYISIKKYWKSYFWLDIVYASYTWWGQNKWIILGESYQGCKSKTIEITGQWTVLMLIFAWLYRNGHHAKALELLKYMQYMKRGLAWEQRGGKNKVFSIDYERSKSIIIIGEINSEFW